VIPYFTPRRGGDVNVCFNLSRELAKCGHEIVIITTSFEFDEEFADSIAKEGVQVITSEHMANIALFIYSPGIKHLIEDEIPPSDIVHMHTFRSYQNIVICKYAKKKAIPYVIQAHGSLPQGPSKKLLKNIYDRIWGYNLLENATAVFALSGREQRQHAEMGVEQSKILKVPNGLNISDYVSSSTEGTFRTQYGIGEEQDLVLYLGRIHPSKGLELLVRAFKGVVKSRDAKLVIVGPDTGYEDFLRRRAQSLGIEDRVLFTGFVSNQRKKEVLYDADVFVTPRFHGFPITFLEAAACGLPIVTTSNGDRLGWINNEVGYVADYNSESLSRSICRVICDRSRAKKMGKRGKEVVRTMFSWSAIAQKVETLYQEFAN
jgi:glycosyltransferase involved in cell wall biosynthesis